MISWHGRIVTMCTVALSSSRLLQAVDESKQAGGAPRQLCLQLLIRRVVAGGTCISRGTCPPCTCTPPRLLLARARRRQGMQTQPRTCS